MSGTFSTSLLDGYVRNLRAIFAAYEQSKLLFCAHLFRIQRDDTCKRLAGRKQILGLTLVDYRCERVRLFSFTGLEGDRCKSKVLVACVLHGVTQVSFVTEQEHARIECYDNLLR